MFGYERANNNTENKVPIPTYPPANWYITIFRTTVPHLRVLFGIQEKLTGSEKLCQLVPISSTKLASAHLHIH